MYSFTLVIKYLKIEENYLIYNNNRNNRILGNKFNEGNERYVQWKLHEFAEIKKDTNKWKDDSCFWMGRNSIIKVSTVPKVIYRSNTLPIRIPKSFCTDTKRIILKFVFQWFAMTYLAVSLFTFLFVVGWAACVLSHSVMSESLWPCGMQPDRLLYPWGFSRQESWNRLLCPPPGALPNCRIELRSPALQVDSLLTELPGKSIEPHKCINCFSSSLGMFWPQLLQLSFPTLFSPLLLVHMLI